MTDPANGAALGAPVAGRVPPARPTLDSVAALAGVSRQTVSNVINLPHLVKPDTAQRVEAAIKTLGYRPHRAAQQLRTRRSRVLGLRVVDDAGAGSGATIFDRFLHGLTTATGELDYRIMLYTAADDGAEIAAYDELVDRWDIDGFILTGTHPGDLRTTHLAAEKVPCVTFGRPWDGSDHHPWVDVDGAAGTYAATRHLIEGGHRSIGFLGWPQGSGVGDDRVSGWATAMAEARLPITEPARCVNDTVQGRGAAAALLDRDDPTALVCASDVLALGATTEITSRGRRVGSDVAVIGFDDTEVARVVGLTSLAQPLTEVAAHCARLIAGLIDDALDGRTPAVDRQVLLAPQLVIRSSSAPPAPG